MMHAIYYRTTNCPLLFTLLLCTFLILLSLSLSSSDNTPSVLSLLKLISSTLLSSLQLFVRLVFHGVANSLVFVIEAIRVPTEALHAVLQKFADVGRSFAGYLVGKLEEATSSMVSAALDLAKECMVKFGEAMVEGAKAFAEKAKEGIEGWCGILVEVMKTAAEGLVQVMSELWNSYVEALNYALEKAKR